MDVEVAHKFASVIGLTVEKRKISFINRLFPQLGKDLEVLLICHISPEDVTKKLTPKKENEEHPSELDVTGSPLEHSFGDDSFNVSISSMKRNWMRYEEKYTPIYLKMAAEMLTCTEEKLSEVNLWSRALFALTDPSENDEKCVLLGTNPDPNGLMPLRARLGGVISLTDIQGSIQMEVPLMNHNNDEMNPKSRKKAHVRVSADYEVCGVDPEVMDFKAEENEDFGGYLRVEATWEEMSFIPPLRKSSSTLVASIVSGSKDSCLHHLWQQLLLLDEYLGILEDYQKRHMSSRYSVAPLNFPKGFTNFFGESTKEIMKKIERIMTGDDCFDDSELIEETPAGESTSEDDYQIKLGDLVRVLEQRQEQDFISGLWRIVKGVESYTVMTDCIHAVFEAMMMGNFKPVMNVGEDTRLARLVGGLDSGKKQLPQLAGSVSMELVVDMGLEKLTRDYSYLLSTGNLMEVYDVREMMKSVAEGEFDINKYREKLMTLAQIHISLEFLQLIQNQLNCRMDVSRSIFESALKIYRGANSPLKLEDLKNHVIYELNAPAPKDIISEVMKTPPASWMCTLTTDTSEQSFSSITHYSRNPIFPPNIYTPEDMQKFEVETEGPIYHVTTGCIIHFKLS